MRYFLLALLLPFAAVAGEATVSWTAPTERTDGTPLDGLSGYIVFWGQASREYTESAFVDALSLRVEGLDTGTWYFTVVAVDLNGLESEYSAEVSKTFAEAPPEPPGDLTVASQTVYTLVQTADRIALVAVGTVPAGTACDATQYVRDSNGLRAYVVPKSAVSWAGTVRAEVVVAECE